MPMPHAAVELVTDEGRECRVCGKKVQGYGPDLLHEGERVRYVAPARADLASFREACTAAERALDRLDGDAPADVPGAARVAVLAVYQAGLLRRTRRTPGSA